MIKKFEKVALGLGVYNLIMLMVLLPLEIILSVMGGDAPILILGLVYGTVYVEVASLIFTVIYFIWRKNWRKKKMIVNEG